MKELKTKKKKSPVEFLTGGTRYKLCRDGRVIVAIKKFTSGDPQHDSHSAKVGTTAIRDVRSFREVCLPEPVDNARW